jgi:3-hydroxyisobutyrate dehydrogenase-like beta-hydroxyacid dehydrogenase
MPRKSRKNVGLIGLGIIGTRVAAGLRASGYQVFVWNRTPRPTPNFLGSPAEIAEICDVIQLFVADAHAVREVIEMCGEMLSSRHTIICCATIGPDATRQIADALRSRGVQFLDAPFTGSKLAAEKAQLCYYVGGDEAVFQRARPVLEATSRAIVRCGGIGDASTLKVATNLITGATTQVLAEALAIVRKSGIAPETLGLALEHNACKSGVIELKLPKMVAGDYDPHFSLKHMFKDVQIGIHMANALGLEIPVTTVTAGVMYGALNHGWADLDFSSLYKVYADGVPEHPPMALPAAPALTQPVAPTVEAQFTEEKSAPAELKPVAAAKVPEPPKTELIEVVPKPAESETKPVEAPSQKPSEPLTGTQQPPESPFEPPKTVRIVPIRMTSPAPAPAPAATASPAKTDRIEPPKGAFGEPPKSGVVLPPKASAPSPSSANLSSSAKTDRIELPKGAFGEPPKSGVVLPPKAIAPPPFSPEIVSLVKTDRIELPKGAFGEPPKSGVVLPPKGEAPPPAPTEVMSPDRTHRIELPRRVPAEPLKAEKVSPPKVTVPLAVPADIVPPAKTETIEQPKTESGELPKLETQPVDKVAEVIGEEKAAAENGEGASEDESAKFRPMQRLRRFFRSST